MDITSARSRLHDFGPGIIAATSFGVCNVLSKLVLIDGSDVLTLVLFRGVVGALFMAAYLKFGPPAKPETPRTRWIGLGIGVLFACIVFSLFKAIELVPVSIALLTYFAYPLITGIIGAMLGLDTLSWRGVVAALIAFFGLTLTIEAHPQELAFAGVALGLLGALCRVAVLLIARSELSDSDARWTTWNSLLSSTAIFIVVALVTLNWQGPRTVSGWGIMVFVSVGSAISILGIFMSTARVGPFRTGLIMNLEPLLATILSVPLLGEGITPLQALGGVIMLSALVAFQLRR